MLKPPKRTCPACDSLGVSATATIAAAVDSDSRCTNCGAGLTYGSTGRAVLSTSFFAGLFLGLITGIYWLGIVVFVVGISSLFLIPVKIDKLDPMSLHRETRKRIAAANSKDKA